MILVMNRYVTIMGRYPHFKVTILVMKLIQERSPVRIWPAAPFGISASGSLAAIPKASPFRTCMCLCSVRIKKYTSVVEVYPF